MSELSNVSSEMIAEFAHKLAFSIRRDVAVIGEHFVFFDNEPTVSRDQQVENFVQFCTSIGIELAGRSTFGEFPDESQYTICLVFSFQASDTTLNDYDLDELFDLFRELARKAFGNIGTNH